MESLAGEYGKANSLARWIRVEFGVPVPIRAWRTQSALTAMQSLTTDYPYGDMKAARQFFDQMPINVNRQVSKIAHLTPPSACSV